MSRLLLRAITSPQTAIALAAASSCTAFSARPVSCDGADSFAQPTFSERTIGNYENRLRRFSSPERVFAYFSSVKINDEDFMTRDDLARAVTPFTYRHGAPLSSKNPQFNARASAAKTSKAVADEYLRRVQKILLESENVSPVEMKKLLAFRDEQRVDFETHVKTLRALEITNAEFDQFLELYGCLPSRAKTFFDLVDADGDGLISYAEYSFFCTLLAIPEQHFELAFKMLDTDNNGQLDHREFQQIMDLMRLRTPAGRQDRSLHDDNEPIFKHLFGEFATKSLSYDEFCAFRRGLKQEIMRIQFEQYDVDGDNALSPREFGMFLVSHVDQRHIGKWVERVDKLRDMRGHITEQEYMDFNVFLEHLDKLEVAINLVMQVHGVDKEQFWRAAKAAMCGNKHTNPVTPLQIDILFALFDLDGDGHLSTTEFIEVMRTRKDSGLNEPRDTGVFNFLKRIKQCIECTM